MTPAVRNIVLFGGLHAPPGYAFVTINGVYVTINGAYVIVQVS